MIPTISVVVAAHQASATLDDALASVAAQTLSPLEVIVVDDASTDGTASIAERWSDRLPMVVVRRPTNGGCGAARRQAVELASGALIAPLDADDVWLPDHLATVTPLATDPQVVVAVRRLRWRAGEEPAESCELWFPRPEAEGRAILRGNLLFYGSIAWRDTILRLGGWGSARRTDDWDTWVRLLARGGCRLVPSPRPTVLYRSGDANLSAADACLPDELALCERILSDGGWSRRQRRILRATRRRLGARAVLLDALAAAEGGAHGRARATFARAALADRSLIGATRPAPLGSVALRAAVGVVSPRLAVRRRRRLLVSKALSPAPQSNATRHPAAPEGSPLSWT